jgi:asparagine N-glycosylation enzyme membrane subunit Stt3
MAGILVPSLLTVRCRSGTLAVAVVFVYVTCLAAMLIENIIQEGALTQYVVVQTVGLIVVSALALFPIVASRRRGERRSPHPGELLSTSTVSGK